MAVEYDEKHRVFRVGPRTEIVVWFECPLSNHYKGEPIVVDGVRWPGRYKTAEHAYQAQKAETIDVARWVARVVYPFRAALRGRCILTGPGWETVKEDVMRAVLRAKFAPGRPEHDALLGTGDLPIIYGMEGTNDYWGVDIRHSNRPGMNRLGHLLMEVREELRQGVPVDTCTYCGDPVILLKTDEGRRWATDPTQKQARRWMECEVSGLHFVEGWRRGK
jgi:ribA/ribD-fused uncharacterized protein